MYGIFKIRLKDRMTINSSLLSVIIPVYNEEDNVLRILERLDSQTLSGFEVIIIDDGSSDHSAEIISKYTPQNYNIQFLQQYNSGAAKARELGIRTSMKEFIAVIDCDDDISNDSLEKTFSVFLNNHIDISLFNLQYVQSIDKKSRILFPYYTTEKIISGKDAFENCILFWGLHAIGIYRREIILKAYDLYNLYAIKNENNINNDEVISRLAFLLANNIYKSDGDYFVINNEASTTRRINENYYKVIKNAYVLYYFVDKEVHNFTIHNMCDAAYSLLISTHWGVTLRYLKWKKDFSDKTVSEWRGYIMESLNTLSNIRMKKSPRISYKNKIQLILIRLILLCP